MPFLILKDQIKEKIRIQQIIEGKVMEIIIMEVAINKVLLALLNKQIIKI